MLRSFRAIAILCALAVPASFYLLAVSPAAAKHRYHGSRHKAGKHRHSDKSEEERASNNDSPPLEARTPVDKADCINVSQSFYRRAASMAGRTSHGIPKEFERVVANLDVFCGEEEFDKARVSIDWMNNCLQNFSQDAKLGYCSRNKSYFCAIDPGSESCRTSKADKDPTELPE